MQYQEVAGGICAPKGFAAAGVHCGIRAEDAAGGIQRVHSGVDALRCNVTAQDRGGIQMGEGGEIGRASCRERV